MKKVSSILIIGIMLMMMLAMAFPTQAAEAGDLGARVLSYGVKGSDVKELQIRLSSLGYFEGPHTGYFGKQTQQAVRKFQRAKGINPTGNVAQATLKAIRGSNGSKTTVSRGNLNRADLLLLARAIHSEARGESYMGQVAVAAVIINRLESPLFPKSIRAIIFQPGAFTAVSDGQFWLEPSALAFKAAKDALEGWDPTNGAIYYYNPKKSTSRWIFSRPIVARIGEHLFAK